MAEEAIEEIKDIFVVQDDAATSPLWSSYRGLLSTNCGKKPGYVVDAMPGWSPIVVNVNNAKIPTASVLLYSLGAGVRYRNRYAVRDLTPPKPRGMQNLVQFGPNCWVRLQKGLDQQLGLVRDGGRFREGVLVVSARVR